MTDHWIDYRAIPGREQNAAGAGWKALRDVHSPQLGNNRDLYVRLPASYGTGERHYPVIYMHDAQNLFDPATSFAGDTWQVDAAMGTLAAEGIEALVVGIPHMGDQRTQEYNPWARGEPYLAFVVETVKPRVDAAFRTLAGRHDTGIIGSSLGGLISIYAYFRYPDVFGHVGGLSPSLWANRFEILSYVANAPLVSGKVYIDHGTREGSAVPLRDVLLRKGYREGTDLCYVREEGGMHRESAWAGRLPGALRFLFGTA
ncbi:MAG: alpha/beta hydrolase [Chloroflexi bacterium]|nr:alpha/beta hydrolase [Chloroflexota bacterium]